MHRDISYLRDRDGDLWALYPGRKTYDCLTADAWSLHISELDAHLGPLSEPVWQERAG